MRRGILGFFLLGVLAASPALAIGSMACKGSSYMVEIQYSLSTGELTELVLASANPKNEKIERFSLQEREVDYRREFMRVHGRSLERPAVPLALRVSHTKGVLSYQGVQHKLICDWSDRD